MFWPTFFIYLLRGLPFCRNTPCRKISDISPYTRNGTRKRILLFNAVPLRQTNFFRFFLHQFVELYNCVPDLDVIEMMNSLFVVNAARPSAPTSSGRETISNNRRLFWRLNETLRVEGEISDVTSSRRNRTPRRDSFPTFTESVMMPSCQSDRSAAKHVTRRLATGLMCKPARQAYMSHRVPAMLH